VRIHFCEIVVDIKIRLDDKDQITKELIEALIRLKEDENSEVAEAAENADFELLN
jgi:hypothetical protein